MYIGNLEVEKITFTHPDSHVVYEPTYYEEERPVWKWSRIFNGCLDINLTLTEDCYIGAVCADIESAAVEKAEILVDGIVCHTHHGGALVDGTVFPVNAFGGVVTVRITAGVENISVGDITVLGMREDNVPVIWPQPKSAEFGDGFVTVSSVGAFSGDADELAACAFLGDRLSEVFSEPLDENGVPLVFVKTDSHEYDGERYTVDVSEDGIVITAASRLALIYGADAFMQTDSVNGFPVMTVDDKPSFPFRGFHIGLPARHQLDFARKLMTYVLIPMRYNAIIVEFCAAMRFDKHPEITEAWIRADENEKAGLQPLMPHSGMVGERGVLEKDEVRDFVQFVKDLGIAVIPEVQSFGHVPWLTYAHPEVAELVDKDAVVKDERVEDARPVDFYPHCYCPSNPKSYELIFDVIDEIIEVTEPEWVHIGHDEIYHIGLCPKCNKRRSDDLYAEDVNKLYNYITSKGKRVMMWSDHLHAGRSAHTKYTAPAIDRIPKDILMLDFTWYFHLEDDIETELLDNGFKVAIGNLYSSHFPRYNKRMSREGMVGGQFSGWVATNEHSLADIGKFFDATLVGLMLWNPDAYDRRLLSCYTNIITSVIQPAMRTNIRGIESSYGIYDATFEVTGDSVPYDLAAVCDAAVIHDTEVDINMNCKTVVFNHATVYPMMRKPWGPFDTVGTYTVHYEDGTSSDIDVRYGCEIMCYRWFYGDPMMHKMYRHTGYAGTWYSDPAIVAKTSDGTDITVCGFEWHNPTPEKKITSISYKDAPDSYAQLILESINVVEAE